MLIGDKGESGGRRWGGVRICYHNIFVQSQGQTLGGVQICPRAIFGQSQGQSLGGVQICYGNISGPPRVSRWVLHFCPRGIFGVVPRSVARRWSDSLIQDFRPVHRLDAGRCPDSLIQDFRTVPRSVAGRWSVWRIPLFRPVARSVAGLCILLIQGFAQGHPLGSHKELTMFNLRILSLDHPY